MCTKLCFVCVCSCTHLKLDDENICSPYLSHMIFNYANESYYEMIANEADRLKILLDATARRCRKNSLFIIGCSIIFIPCNLTTGAPIPLCSNDCSSFESECYDAFSALINFSKFYDYPYIQNCQNTLSHLNMYFNFLNSSSDFKDNCLALPGTLHVIVAMYAKCQIIPYIIVIRMHQGVYEFYKPKGPRL